MARPPSKQPADGELEILKILWETGPAGLGQIHTVLQERRGVATTTVATMLKMSWVVCLPALVRSTPVAGAIFLC